MLQRTNYNPGDDELLELISSNSLNRKALSQHTVDLEHLPYFLFSFAVFDHGYNPTNAFDSMREKGVRHGQIHRILL